MPLPTLPDIISHWATTWRHLTAWGAPLPATFTIKPYDGQRRLGRANCHTRKVEILHTNDLAEDLATVLHELAHIAAPSHEHHGPHWRTIYINAVTEAVRHPLGTLDPDVVITDLDAQVKDAVHRWLLRTGQAQVLKAIGVITPSRAGDRPLGHGTGERKP